MKNRTYISFLLILILSFSLMISNINAQELIQILEDFDYITKFDVNSMAENHLTQYKLIRKRAKWNYGREYLFKINSKDNLFITIGIHSSRKDAYNIANEYQNNTSALMKEDQFHELSIGDKLWWWSPNQDTNNITNIIYVRKNILIILNSNTYTDLKKLARLIDNNIVNVGSYICIDKILKKPEIQSISMDKKNIKINEVAKIKINAFDPNSESLEYQFSTGLTKLEGNPDRIFTYIASDRRMTEQPPIDTIKVVVINESNVVSDISEIEIKYIK